MKRTKPKKKKRGWNGGMRPTEDEAKQADLLGYVTATAAAAAVGVSISTVLNWIKAGKLPQVHPERLPSMKAGAFRWVYLDSVKAMKPDMAEIAKGVTP